MKGAWAVLSAAFVASACGSTTDNPVDEGQPIPDTSIVSCGDDLRDSAAPAGGLSNATITVTASATTLATDVIFQASCPKKPSSAMTEIALDKVTIYEDDAGYPGAELESHEVETTLALSCGDRDTDQIGGTSKKETLEPITLESLAAACDDHKKNPTGSALKRQVELHGKGTTCSSTTSELTIRGQVTVTCPQ